ncbi:MAG: PLP-dependent transferase [Armatimonadetes bacterium]|nr:PLP-dependent transferase [Armatimonadota bacterium]
MKFQTRAIHAGQDPDARTGAVVPPIYQNVTHVMDEPGAHRGFDYLRSINPTRRALEECLAELEGATHCVCYSSGMAAATAVASTLKPGDHAIASHHVYAGTYRYFSKILSDYGIEITFVNTEDALNIQRALRGNTRMIWVETPGNPLGTISDIRAIAEIAHAHPGSPFVAVDSTMASPYCQQPLSLGADVVLHSTTKYISGHLDVLGGALMTNRQDLHDAFFYFQNATGPTPSPFDNWLTLRGVRTLGLRMQAHQENAMAVARFLESHPRVQWVMYCGLPSHPQHEVAKRQMTGFSGMVSADFEGGLEAVTEFTSRLKVWSLAESLGGVESLISHSATMTHAPLSREEQEEQGITQGVCRLSVGLEDAEDLVEDLRQALA